MTKTTHRIKVEFNTVAETNVIEYYALDAATLRKAQLWQAAQKTQPTAEQFLQWLHDNGGQRDRADGPAYIKTFKDGTSIECWYRKGQLDRAGGPAVIQTYKNGTRREAWYRDDKFIKEEKTAPPISIPGVVLDPPAPQP